MSEPFFTVAIPTKNRPDLVANAVRSVLEQTFADLELIVCDNSDGGAETETTAALAQFDDPRLRIVRTDGTLAMHDNWERSVEEARGTYVGVLTDRSVYRPETLAVAHAEIERTGVAIVGWFSDSYGRDDRDHELRRRPCTFRRFEFASSDVLGYFVDGQPKYATKVVPKLMTGVFHRSLLEAARGSAVGRICPAVCPDYTSGFLALAFSDRLLLIDEPLYVSCGQGTGSAFRTRSELGERFQRDLGLTWSEMVDRMPSEACFSHALVLNDLMRLRNELPEELGPYDLNRIQYYLGCLTDFVKTYRHGVNRDEDLALLVAAIEDEPRSIRDVVQSTSVYRKALFRAVEEVPAEVSPPATNGNGSTGEQHAAPAAGPAAPVEPKRDHHEAADVFAAIAWDAANPRVPIDESFLDRLPLVPGPAEIVPDPTPRAKEPGTLRALRALRMRVQLRQARRRLLRVTR
jgi:glycosyltransferase involved in cell wall biosynthesis